MRPDDGMTDKIEQQIDAALKMLSEGQPPVTMRSRVQRSLEAAAVTPQQVHRGGLLWIPVMCAAMATVLLVIFLQVHSARGKQNSPIETVKMMTTESAPPRLVPSQPLPVPAKSSREGKVSVMNIHQNSHRRERDQYRHAVNLLSYPLTRQEKLLVKFAQTAKPADLQILNPEYQAKVDARQDAEFAAYLESGSSSNYHGTTENNQE